MITEDLGIFKHLDNILLKRIVVIVEITWGLFMAVLYFQILLWFAQFALMLLVAHLITVIGLPSVFSKLNNERREESLHFSGVEEQEEGLNEIDLWDRAVVGFYVVTNACIVLIFLVAWIL